jgi:hypothetical protein
MGKTAFSGPVYGAKSLLWSWGPYTDAHSTGASTGAITVNPVPSRTVPNYEDWMITEMYVTCSTNSSVAGAHGFYLKSEGGSTTGIVRADGQPSTVTQTVISVLNTGTSTNFAGSAAATATAGEYEGKWVPAGSTLRLVSSGVSLTGTVLVNVMGYIRYVNSTRPV